MKIKTALAAFALSLSAAISTPVMASYPEKPITIVCWSSAGSGHDLMARYIAKLGEKYLGQPIVVVNKKGAEGKVAMSYVLNQKADGHVIMTNTRSMTERLKKTGDRIAIDSFKYVSRVVKDPFVITVAQDSPFNTVADLVTFAKAHPNKVKIGGYSTKSVDEGLVKELEAKANIDLNYIPYKGGNEPVIAVLGGHIDVALANPSEMLANFEAGKLKVLAVASDERFEPFEASPTLTEQGYDIVTEHWRGVMASKDVPDEVIAKLNKMIEQVVAEPEFEKFLAGSNMYNGYLPSDKFGELVVSQTPN
ncbi:tripartite tricarboxylate transporter substrate binding protein [Oceanimonas pelagia]|uniref:Tripartite tricarboxylate transporter substrate binding protein n=1 Tax=Oceanimonas pelagia TaxID=3028314 RepID=A0AA50KLY5_9GAMM|nr:tripartite tricarboxylate transporter substrate binding protein [Oceanimonas pelagia]WMC10260.1 tripartite tricarboxylate transporter substrate binding protein [Oceanimonas pelagia]